MKKNFLRILAIAAFASYNVYRSNNNETEGMSDTMLANVEALAGGESSNSEGRLYCPYDGYGCQVNYTNGTSQIFWGLSPNYHP